MLHTCHCAHGKQTPRHLSDELSPLGHRPPPMSPAPALWPSKASTNSRQHWSCERDRWLCRRRRGIDVTYFIDESLGLRKIVVSVKEELAPLRRSAWSDREQAHRRVHHSNRLPADAKRLLSPASMSPELLVSKSPIQILTIEQLLGIHRSIPTRPKTPEAGCRWHVQEAKRQYRSEGEQQALL